MNNYTPAIIADTNNLSEKEWLKYRRNGIGGSDTAAVFGLSPFKTTRDLYYEKLGERTNDVSKNWVQLAYGTILEDLVGKIFSKKTGFRIEKDTNMYVHPLYDFMFANLDFVTYDHKGKKCILECKTTSFFNKDKWEDGVPIYYELQCRHMMSVTNIDVCYIACLWDNNEDSFIYYRIDRDLEIEKEMIKKEEFFWYDYVWSGMEPALTENSKLSLSTIKNFKSNEPMETNQVTIPNYLKTNIKDYLSTREARLALSKKLKIHEEQEKLLYLPILDELKSATKGYYSDSENNYFISNKLIIRTSINKENLEKLKLKYPEIYEEFVTATSSSSFSIKVAKNKLTDIVSSFNKSRELQNLVSFLSKYDITTNKAVKIQNHFEGNAIEVIKERPFKMCEISGFGFITVDKIARSIDCKLDDSLRIQEAINYVLTEASGNGHLYLDENSLTDKVHKLLNNGFDTQVVDLFHIIVEITAMVDKNILYNYKNNIYLYNNFNYESTTSKNIARLLNTKKHAVIQNLNEVIENSQKRLGINLGTEQSNAVEMCIYNNISIITGGPGTGKTTTLKVILDVYKTIFGGEVLQYVPRRSVGNCDQREQSTIANAIALLAPTGRASRRMSESTGCNDAQTIHRALGLTNDDYSVNENNLESDFVDRSFFIDKQ